MPHIRPLVECPFCGRPVHRTRATHVFHWHKTAPRGRKCKGSTLTYEEAQERAGRQQGSAVTDTDVLVAKVWSTILGIDIDAETVKMLIKIRETLNK